MRLDRDAARRQRIARVLARPLDPERHRPGRRPAAVAGQRDAPAQQAARRHPLGGDDAARIGAGGAQRGDGRRRCRRCARPSAPDAAGRDRRLQRRRRRDRTSAAAPARRLGIDRDELEVGLRIARRRRATSSRLCVPISACRPPGCGATPRVASHQAAPCVEAARGDDEMVEAPIDGRPSASRSRRDRSASLTASTSPRMQVTRVAADPDRRALAGDVDAAGAAERACPARRRSARARGPSRSAIARGRRSGCR